MTNDLERNLTLADRDRLSPGQLLRLAVRGYTLTDSERLKLSTTQLLILHCRLGQTLSYADREKFNGHQLLLLARSGCVLTNGEKRRLSPHQLMIYNNMLPTLCHE